MKAELTIYKNETIKKALEVINDNSKGAVVVTDFDEKLIRLLTDGDIRRALLGGFQLDSTIEEIPLNGLTVTISEEDDYDYSLKLMDEKAIDHIVVTDSNKKVLGLHHRKEISPILLSVPHMGKEEMKYVGEAFETNWIAPLGPNVDGFEREITEFTGAKYAAALSSGTAALHLSMVLLDIKRDDIVLCSSLTFAASAFPILYQNATPVFIDSEPGSWNMSPQALERALKHYLKKNLKPKAIVVVNLYGQSADMDEILALSKRYDVPIIEDAAESLGATYKGKQSGTFGLFGVYSFNGNKIITTSGGGMLVSDNKELINKAKFLSTQARDASPYYQHSQIGYNYRMSNVLAGIGRGQLKVLPQRIDSRRKIFDRYVDGLQSINCIKWMEDLDGYYSNRWLTTLLLSAEKSKVTVHEFIKKLNAKNIEARHVWKPMHLQPIFSGYCYFPHEHGFSVSNYLFENGVCLPSGSNMVESEQDRVIYEIQNILK